MLNFVRALCFQEEAQAGNKIAGRNINNLRYADDTTLMAGSEEELKSLSKVKEESKKADLKLKIQKTNIMTSGPITSWEIDGDSHYPASKIISSLQIIFEFGFHLLCPL